MRHRPQAGFLVPISALCAILLASSSGLAEESRRYPALFHIYYDYAVAEYCGMIDRPVHDGFVLLRKFLLARDRIGVASDYAERISANMVADDEYLDRGLSGPKLWCRTEGVAAAQRFTRFFQRRALQ